MNRRSLWIIVLILTLAVAAAVMLPLKWNSDPGPGEPGGTGSVIGTSGALLLLLLLAALSARRRKGKGTATMADVLFFAPFFIVPLLAFSVPPAFFGRFFFLLAIAAVFWISFMGQGHSHGPDSPGLVYGLVAQCVAVAAVLAEVVHFVRGAVKRRRLSHG